jgi:hypothetical protein
MSPHCFFFEFLVSCTWVFVETPLFPLSLHACPIFERVGLDDFDVVLQLEKSLMARPYLPASSSRLE